MSNEHKIITSFRYQGYGWTEHIFTTATALADVREDAIEFTRLRARLLPPGCAIEKCTISNVTTGLSRAIMPGEVQGIYTMPGAGLYTGVLDWLLAEVGIRFEQIVGSRRHGFRVLTLVPRLAVKTELGGTLDLGNASLTTYKSWLDTYRDYLLDPSERYVIQHDPVNPTKVDILGWARRSPTTDLVGPRIADVSGITAGSKVKFHGVRSTPGAMPITGVHKVADVSSVLEDGTYHVWIEGSASWSPEAVYALGKLSNYSRQYSKLTELNVLNAVTKQRGKGNFGPVGRSKKKR